MIYLTSILLLSSYVLTYAYGDGIRYVKDDGCSLDDRIRINNAYSEAMQLAAWAYKSRNYNAYADLRRRYFGGSSPNYYLPQKVQDRFYTASDWYDGFFRDRSPVLLTCKDWYEVPRGLKKKCDPSKTTAAYTFNKADGPIITFCRYFLDNPSSSIDGPVWRSLDDRYYWLVKNRDKQKVCKKLSNLGHVFLHEMMRVKWIAGNPAALDVDYRPGYIAYGPYGAETLARTDAFEARNNADNYAMYANAVWFSWYFNDCNVPATRYDKRSNYSDSTVSVHERDEIDDLDDGKPLPDDTLGVPSFTIDPQQPSFSDITQKVYQFEHPPGEGIISQAGLSGKTLRILPLGDSITTGWRSSEGNGYRQYLIDLLRGNSVDMVGRYTSGTMSDPDMQGVNGATIDQMLDNVAVALQSRPNVVLLHAGTNDMNGNIDSAGAPQRLSRLIDTIFSACPDTTIFVAEIIASGSDSTQARILAYNWSVRSMVQDRAEKGQHIVPVPLSKALDTTDYADTLHPNDRGYADMAQRWYDAIRDVGPLGWLADPVVVPPSKSGKTSKPCDKLPNWIPNGEIANGAGLGSNIKSSIICIPDSTQARKCRCGTSVDKLSTIDLVGTDCKQMGHERVTAVRFADLDGDGRNEYLWIGDAGEIIAFRNGGPRDIADTLQAARVIWYPSGMVASGVGGRRHQIHLADLNGDGRADYIWVHEDGSVDAWINGGWQQQADGSAKIGWLPQGTIATGIGMPGASIRFADINGDGRADYLAVGSDGSVYCYLNGNALIDNGPNAGRRNWIDQGKIASGVGGTRSETVFADIDGDGRDDYLRLTRDGSGKLLWWKNLEDRAYPASGPEGGKVVWWERGSITGGDGSPGINVELADLTNDGRAEYLKVNADTSAVFAYWNGCPG